MATLTPALLLADCEDPTTPPAGVTLADAWAALVYERIAQRKLREAYRALMSGQATMMEIDPKGIETAVLRLRVRKLDAALAALVSACEEAVRPPERVAEQIRAARVALGYNPGQGSRP